MIGISKNDWYKLQKDFIERFPIDSLDILPIEKYTNLNRSDSLCYWLESVTYELGSIWGGSSYKFGIFKYDSTPKDKYNSLDDEYAWYRKLGTNRSDAYNNIRNGLKQIAKAAASLDFQKIESNTVYGDACKWKLAFIYSGMKLIPIYSKDLFRKLCKEYGMPKFEDATMLQMQNFMLSKKGEADIYDFYNDLLTMLDSLQENGKVWMYSGDANTFNTNTISMGDSVSSKLTDYSLFQSRIELGKAYRQVKGNTDVSVPYAYWQFINNVSVGDIVAVFSNQRKGEKNTHILYGYGKITSELINDIASDSPLKRNVEWIEKCDETVVDTKTVNSMFFHGTNKDQALHIKELLKITTTPQYWVFKHRPGSSATETECMEFVKQAITYNYAFMQYEYGIQDENRMVTMNWNRVLEIKEGDYIFLRGGDNIYAVGRAIRPRLTPDVTLNIRKIINTKDHGQYRSDKYDKVIHFDDSDVFYENLSDGENNWGQRIDVDGWKYFTPQGIWAKSQSLYKSGENEYGVLKELTKESGESIIEQLYKRMGMKAEITTLLKSNHNLVLTGAPGTGKTYLAKQVACFMLFGKSDFSELSDNEREQYDECVSFVQFHPSYDYTDFVEGLRPKSKDNDEIGFERKDGVFKTLCKDAIGANYNLEEGIRLFKENLNGKQIQSYRSTTMINIVVEDNTIKVITENSKTSFSDEIIKDGIVNNDFDPKHETYRPSICKYIKENFLSKNNVDKPHIMIIDEINRGELSKIFGELFYAIDNGYRGEKGKIKTQYQNLVPKYDAFYNGFYVPENVYILGTMNDIDRSVESMDFAMRRRFAWREIKTTERISMLKGNLTSDVFDTAKSVMEHLNAEIVKTRGLGSAYQIGPAYFLKLKDYNGNFKMLWDLHIEILLRDYLRGYTNAEDKIKEFRKVYETSTGISLD